MKRNKEKFLDYSEFVAFKEWEKLQEKLLIENFHLNPHNENVSLWNKIKKNGG